MIFLRAPILLTALIWVNVVSGQSGARNDTGQSEVYTASSVSVDPEPAGFPGQDARYGRDAAAADGALAKQGAGAAGFDFSKVTVTGDLLGVQDQPWSRDAQGFDDGSEVQGTRWSCVLDHVTGLLWEVKTYTAAPGLRDREWTYSWYSSAERPDGTANASNGGSPGGVNRGECLDKFDADSNPGGNYCDTAGYVAVINESGLCGFNDWRMPTLDELRSIVHYGARGPAIDTGFFPNVPGDFSDPGNPFPNVTWTGTPTRFDSSAWSVYFDFGAQINPDKNFAGSVRLVRSEP
jgi:hypothetical protein